MSKKKVLIAVGGTGGHVFPAASLGKELIDNNVEVKFVGGGLLQNKYFDRKQFSFQEITCGFLSTRNPIKFLKGMLNVGRGILEGRKILKEFGPDVVVGFGSFYTFPILSAAKLTSSAPIILHEQNAIPGRVNRLLSPYVNFTAVSMPDASKVLAGNVRHVEMPLKVTHHISKEKARNHYGLAPEKRTILIFGGSQGAGVLNHTFLKSIPGLKDVQIIHFTGNSEMTLEAKEFYHKHQILSCVKDFEGSMNYAWSAADLAITRSGASTIAEAIEYEVPLIMCPFPKAMDNHQEKNADFMIQTVGGGEKILEKNLMPNELALQITGLPLDKMKQSIIEYKNNTKSPSLLSLVVEILGN
jgi:UDP-N-acetylglucosamine--N-acetylmuramyl-(pentapeptide) pyrophosphoryl-undecaprenol N-acetylglucosamine transferase